MMLSKVKLTGLVLLCSAFLGAKEIPPEIPLHGSPDRGLCTTLTQGQSTRFERCSNGEVMTGIRSLDPLMVYCTRLLANCRSSAQFAETENGRASNN